MKEIFIGVDFSLNSPSICIFKDNSYKFISLATKVKKPKYAVKIQEDIYNLEDVEGIYQSDYLTSKDYSTNELLSLVKYRSIVNELWNLILDEIGNPSENLIYVAFEGYSFNSFSRSDNIIDIASATTLLRDKFLENVKHLKFEVASPKTLKKFAGYGSFDKEDMLDVFTGNYDNIKLKYAEEIQKDFDKKVSKGKPSVFNFDFNDKNIKGPFYDYCVNYSNSVLNRTNKRVVVAKPIDDIIDSYFVCNWLKYKFGKF